MHKGNIVEYELFSFELPTISFVHLFVLFQYDKLQSQGLDLLTVKGKQENILLKIWLNITVDQN